jgi:ubiquinone biosynthesis O-methyltransferase
MSVRLGLVNEPVRRPRARNDPAQYEELADEWWKPRGSFAMLHWLASARAALVPPPPRPGAILLDVACGGGLLAPRLHGTGYAHVGVDLSPSATRVARGHGLKHVLRGDALALPLRDETADVVAAGEILEHVADLPTVVKECCRVLRPGGTLIIDTIANTHVARVVAISIAERLPGGPPRDLHDPALFVDREKLMTECAPRRTAPAARAPPARTRRGPLARQAAQRRPHGSRPLDSGVVPGRRGKGAHMTPAEALEAARELAPRLAGRAARYDTGGAFPSEDFADLAAAGLLGLMVPARLGGAGAGFADYAEVAMALATGSPATALIYNMHASVTGALALTPDEVARALGAAESFFTFRDEVLRAAAQGALYAVAMSERGIGSRLSQVRTWYEPAGRGWRIKGSKAFCSGAGHAQAYLVAARRDDKVSYFLVPGGDGVTVEPTWDSLGMRATASHDLHIDATVGPEALLGGVEGLTLLLAQVMPQWLVASYAAVYAAIARAAVDAAAADLGTRDLLTSAPAVRARLGRGDAQAAAAQEVVRRAARQVDGAPGDDATTRWIWRAKLIAGDTAQDVAASMLEACGASATRRGHPLERMYRDARCGALQPATSDVCADWLGCAVGGLDPDGQTPRW